MKTIITFLLFSLCCFSQIKHDKFDFFNHNNEVYWQKTFNKENTSKESLFTIFEQYIIKNIKHDNLRTSENTLTFVVKEVKLNPKDFGYKAMTTPIFVQSFQEYLCVVDFKDNKYRITIKNISFTNNQLGLGYFNDKLEELVIDKKKNNFKIHKNTDISFDILEKFYTNTYNPDKITLTSNDW